jgi:hypothetical protein
MVSRSLPRTGHLEEPRQPPGQRRRGSGRCDLHFRSEIQSTALAFSAPQQGSGNSTPFESEV